MSKIEEALEKANKIRETRTPPLIERFRRGKKGQSVHFSNEHIVTHDQTDTSISEEYRRLKSMLIRETKADFLNMVMITSAIESEGKTLTSINLAITLAQEIDHSILLIDADLRRPMIHEYLGIKYKYGLSDYLNQDMDIADILVKTEIDNLVILPAGHSVSNPVELLSSQKMKALMGELKHRYMDRYIIIDTPPVLPFADTIAIGPSVDGVILVVQEGRAQKTAIEETMNMIKSLNILGVVYNSATSGNIDGHYSKYYKSGYKYRRKEK